MKKYFCLSILLLCAQNALAEELPSKAELWKMIKKQQAQIEKLQKKIEETDQKVEATGTMIEDAQQNVSASPSWTDKTSIGGYGELHYNGGEKDQIDFHRFVLFAGHEFNDDVRFQSEIELEHALSGDDKPGEVELEQAYVEFDLFNDTQQARAGVFLVPVGILNETHEPPTFYGVERNPVETNIIPSTWWEAGLAWNKTWENGLRLDLAMHSGLNTPVDGDKSFLIRSGRQKVAEAEAEDFAYTGRLRYTGMPGLEVATSVQYQSDITQGNFVADEVDATLIEAHFDYEKDGWGLKGLYANWDLGGDAPKATGRDEQNGWYIEPSYKFETAIGELGLFARYNEWDNNAGSSGGNTDFEQIDVGLNYWPIKNVVLKADVAFVDGPTDADEDEILNLGVGYQF